MSGSKSKSKSQSRVWKRGLAVAGLLSLGSSLMSCGGGSQEELADVTDLDQDCSGECGTLVSESLSVADVQDVIARGVAEAQALGVQATIAVTDRVGNVLGVFRMGLPQERTLLVSTGTAADGSQLINAGLEGLTLPVSPFPFSGANICLLYTSPSPRDLSTSRMPSSA